MAAALAAPSVAAGNLIQSGNGAFSPLNAAAVGPAGSPQQVADGARRYSSPSYLEQMREADGRARDRRGRRASRRERDGRRASRSAHRGLGRGAAWRLAADSFGGPLTSSVRGGPRLGRGERVRRFVNDYWAEVTRDGASGTGLLRSFVPMRAKDESGEKRPVDLDLVDRGASFEPANPLARVRFGKRADEGMRFEDSGVKLVPRGAAAAGSVENDRVFYPGIARDTDFVAMPTETGAESFWSIR